MFGIGTDIVDIKRIVKVFKDYPERFPEKVLSTDELNIFLTHPRQKEYLAGRFAAKEAILKALGTGLRNASWTDISVLNDEIGKPLATLKGNLLLMANDKNIKEIHVSISHSDEYAVAFCIIE